MPPGYNAPYQVGPYSMPTQSAPLLDTQKALHYPYPEHPPKTHDYQLEGMHD